MGLTKTSENNTYKELEFSDLKVALSAFKNSSDIEEKEKILEKIQTFEGGVLEIIKILKECEESKIISYICAHLSKITPKDAPIEEIMELLKSENAYLRNVAISLLQDYGDEIKYYIVKYLIGDDRDLRIFAINVLGDVNFKESRDMLVELLESEMDINVAMSAVDYLAEIGEIRDIELLESLKERFIGEPYVSFAIDRAIKMIRG